MDPNSFKIAWNTQAYMTAWDYNNTHVPIIIQESIGLNNTKPTLQQYL